MSRFQGAIGHVLAVGHDDDDQGGRSYWVKVQYDYDGEPVTVRVGISHRDQQQYQAGQRVGLTFAPSRPRIVRLDPPDWAVPKARDRPKALLVGVRRAANSAGRDGLDQRGETCLVE